MKPMYKRVLLKLSGEALSGDKGFGINNDVVNEIAVAIKKMQEVGVEVSVVVGGGNFWRGRCNTNMDRCSADHIGMLATTMNALALQDGFRQLGVESRVQTGIEMRQIAEFYIRNKAIRHLEKNRILILGCGTGSPFFSTDTAASLRAAEINCDIILKATNVDGIFDKDPNVYEVCKQYEQISYIDVLNKKINVMDSTSISLCMDNEIPILVFNATIHGNLKRAVMGENIGTLVK